MGETGCGKTRLLRYLCELASHDELESGDKANLVILKVDNYRLSKYYC